MGVAVARAQDEQAAAVSAPVTAPAPTPLPPAGAQGQAAPNARVTLANGSQLYGGVLLYAPGQKLVLEYQGQTLVLPWSDVREVLFDPAPIPPVPVAAPTPAPASPPAANAVGIAHADYFRAQELVRLESQRQQLRASNRRWQVPALGLGLGIVSIFVGVGALIASWNSSCYQTEWEYSCEENTAAWRAGVALLTIGPVLTLVSTPMLIIRASRASRLKRLERTIQRLGGTLSLAPTFSPSSAGFAVRAAF